MKYPRLNVLPTSQQIIDTFYGYNRGMKIADGEFFDTHNLSTSYFPMMATRQPRKLYKTLTEAQGIIEKDALAYVDNGTLYYNDYATPITGLSAGDKQLVSMGAYICIFPDNKYYNTADPTDYGSMGAVWNYSGSVSCAMCNISGEVYSGCIESTSAPSDPANGDLWLDISSTPYALKEWSSTNSMWLTIETVYMKITFSTTGQLPSRFSVNDGIELSGSPISSTNGSKIIYAMGGDISNSVSDYIVVISEPFSGGQYYSRTIRIARNIPAMDYVCECQNRLWGCRYGNNGSQNINELYCCALGDFKNWEQYLGVSTDSWRASVGSDGVWTGCVNYLGNPVFFKENRIHTISVSSLGAHQVSDTPARGVQQGSSESLVVVNETLFYKSRTDVCSYQGGFPVSVSAKLGDERYSQACAGAFGNKYYISMLDSSNTPQLFVYDIGRGLWIKEDNTRFLRFVKLDDSLLALTPDNKIYDLNGVLGTAAESKVKWMFESGVMHYEYPGRKYVSRYEIRANMSLESQCDLFIMYDSSGNWERAGSIRLKSSAENVGTVTLPIKPRRCDHLRLKLAGEGMTKLFSISRFIEKGSDR